MQRIVVAKKVDKFKALGYKVVKEVQKAKFGAGSVKQFLMEKSDPKVAPAPKAIKPKKKE